MIMITYKIVSTMFTVDAEGVQDRITMIIWNASKSIDSVNATITSRGTAVPADYAPADAVYETLTAEDLQAWILDLEDQAGIDAQLTDALNSLMAPTEGSGLPWQDGYPLWAVGVYYEDEWVVIYDGIGYECIQTHSSQSQWAPPATPALWKYYVPASEGPQPWVQPIGSEDSYPLGAQVTHVGHLWTSDVDANVWEPPTQWTDEGVYP